MTRYVSSFHSKIFTSRARAIQLIYPSKFMYLAVIGLVTLLVGLYVFILNDTTTHGYRIREIERNIESVKRENRGLELRVAELKSMRSVQDRLIGQGFVPVAHVEYVETGAPSVALR